MTYVTNISDSLPCLSWEEYDIKFSKVIKEYVARLASLSKKLSFESHLTNCENIDSKKGDIESKINIFLTCSSLCFLVS